MEEKETVSFQVHEGAMTRMERSNRRLLIALVVVVVVMLINNIAWIAFEDHRQDIQQVTYEKQTEQDS